MSHFLATIILILIMVSLKQIPWIAQLGDSLTPATMMVGFIILISYMSGKAASKVKLPRITGYMIIGVVIGPYCLNFLTHEMSHQLHLINGLALSLIALTAGGELKFKSLRKVWKSVSLIALLHVVTLWIFFILFTMLLKPFIPFLAELPNAHALAAGLIMGTIAAASSPAIAMAVISESRARGQMTESILSITVLKDILVIVLFLVALAVSKALINPDIAFNLSFLKSISIELSLSVVVGIILGGFITVYLRYVNRENTLFLLCICFLSAELSLKFHLEPVLMALTAGLLMENVVPERGERLVHALEQGSLPVYTLFFCLAGSILSLDALKEMWVLALVFVALRLIILYAATLTGSILGKGPEPLKKYGWLGFISQAGVSLGLVAMLNRSFPTWGVEIQTLLIAVISINEMVGPICFRQGLLKAKEAHA